MAENEQRRAMYRARLGQLAPTTRDAEDERMQELDAAIDELNAARDRTRASMVDMQTTMEHIARQRHERAHDDADLMQQLQRRLALDRSAVDAAAGDLRRAAKTAIDCHPAAAPLVDLLARPLLDEASSAKASAWTEVRRMQDAGVRMDDDDGADGDEDGPRQQRKKRIFPTLNGRPVLLELNAWRSDHRVFPSSKRPKRERDGHGGAGGDRFVTAALESPIQPRLD